MTTVPAVCLVILDGWGLAEPGPGNAVELADTPVFDGLWDRYPHTTLTAWGESVAEMILDDMAQVVHGNIHARQAGARQPLQLALEQRHSPDVHHRLRDGLRHRAQPHALSSGHDDGV